MIHSFFIIPGFSLRQGRQVSATGLFCDQDLICFIRIRLNSKNVHEMSVPFPNIPVNIIGVADDDAQHLIGHVRHRIV